MITWNGGRDRHYAVGTGYSIVHQGKTWRILDKGRATGHYGFRSLEAAKRCVEWLVQEDIQAARRWGSWRGYPACVLEAAISAENPAS